MLFVENSEASKLENCKLDLLFFDICGALAVGTLFNKLKHTSYNKEILGKKIILKNILKNLHKQRKISKFFS
jgi:hypothetical protein